MNSIITEFALIVSGSVVLTILAKSTVILLLGLTAGALAVRAKASWRHLVFATTFAAVLALPIVVTMAPDFAVEVPPASASLAERSSLTPAVMASVATSGVETTPVQVAQSTPGTRAEAWSAASLAAALLLLWAGGGLVLMGLLAIDMWRVRQLRRHGIPSERIQNIADSLTEYGKRRVEIMMHENILAPVTFGFWRPAVMLPTDAEKWDEPDLRRALIHELEHVHRADWATQLAARTACSLYWFHPLVWMAWRRLCLEAERACDDAVVESAGHTEYAEQLVSLSRQLSGTREHAVLGMAKRSDLSRRVSALLDETCRRGRAGLTAAAFSIFIGMFVLVAIGPLRAVAQSSPAPAADKPTPRTIADRREPEDDDDDDDDYRGRNKLDSALFKAAERNAIERVKGLLEEGANVNAVLPGDGTPLIAAAKNGHLEMVRLLLDRGAKPDLGVKGDGNPLLNAAREGHRDVVTLLLERGADVDAGVEGDGNALIMASGGGFVDIVALLLERGANIHKVVAGDENPIIKACETGQLDVVKLLLDKGADINSRVRVEMGWGAKQIVEYRTPLSMARKGGHKPLVDYLLSKGAREQ